MTFTHISTMHNSDWSKLIRDNDKYKYEPKFPVIGKENCTIKLAFTQIAFDHDEEALIAVDIKGYLHYIELSEKTWYSKRLQKVGQASFLMFNSLCKGEVLIGLDTGDIKIWKLYVNVELSILSGHKLAPTHASLYKNYCLTSSQKEIIIWHLRSYNKAHQLKTNTKIVIKKAAFSSMGHIVVLYHNDTMQIWMFGQLEKDTKIDAKVFGIRYIRDFTFMRDGRAMIIGSEKKISVINTHDWSLLKQLSLPKNLVNIKQLSIISCLLNGDVHIILVLLSSKNTLHFGDISTSNFVEVSNVIKGIKKFAISPSSRYIAYIDKEDCLNIVHTDKMILEKCQPKKLPEPPRVQAHKINDHLECIKQDIRRELDIKRLMPILQEFGEYPEKYRALIWSIILKLPANRRAYVALASKVTRRKFALNILKDYPLADKCKASLLAMTMDCLIHWYPPLIQSPFLPKLIFPFLMVFQKDPLLAFELILSILLNYCQKWFEYHPLPPLNILGIVENILLEADPMLLNIFYQHKITTSEYAWPLLQTAMSEVLSGDEWLILWDHLISFQKPSLLLMCVVAYSIYSKESIICLIKSCGDIVTFYNSQSHVRAKDLLKIARRLDQEISDRTHPNRYLRDKILQLNCTGPYYLFISEEYPKFSTENFSLTNLEKFKIQAQLQDNHKIAERKRLHQEARAFAKQIHEARLNETQKCFQKQIDNLNWKLEKLLSDLERKKSCYYHPYNNSNDLQLEMIQESNKCKNMKNGSEILSTKSNNYEKLQRDVTKLEYEVQNFLDSLGSCRLEY